MYAIPALKYLILAKQPPDMKVISNL